MGALHLYTVDVRWTGAGETGTTSYTTYDRDHELRVEGRPVLLGSSDPAFRGDPARWSPEQLFVATLSQCHMLWFLHLASADGVVVVDYRDEAVGRMRVESAGAGQFTDVLLHPRIAVRCGDEVTDERVAALHQRAHEHCFIARSVNFPVRHEPVTRRVGSSISASEPGTNGNDDRFDLAAVFAPHGRVEGQELATLIAWANTQARLAEAVSSAPLRQAREAAKRSERDARVRLAWISLLLTDDRIRGSKTMTQERLADQVGVTSARINQLTAVARAMWAVGLRPEDPVSEDQRVSYEVLEEARRGGRELLDATVVQVGHTLNSRPSGRREDA